MHKKKPHGVRLASRQSTVQLKGARRTLSDLSVVHIDCVPLIDRACPGLESLLLRTLLHPLARAFIYCSLTLESALVIACNFKHEERVVGVLLPLMAVNFLLTKTLGVCAVWPTALLHRAL